MHVSRVRDERGSHIEPSLNDLWTNLEKLRWSLAVVLHDFGFPADLMTVEPAHMTVDGVPVESYVLTMPGRVVTAGGYYEAWRTINALEIGVWLARKVAA